MTKTPVEPTNAKNLEAKFEIGEDVLDYFDLCAAKTSPPKKVMAPKTGRTAPAKDRLMKRGA